MHFTGFSQSVCEGERPPISDGTTDVTMMGTKCIKWENHRYYRKNPSLLDTYNLTGHNYCRYIENNHEVQLPYCRTDGNSYSWGYCHVEKEKQDIAGSN